MQVTTEARALMDALKFTEEDLQANRAGRLSETQRQALAKRSILFAALAVVSGVLLALAYFSLPAREGEPVPLLSLGLMPTALALLGFSLFELFNAFVKLQRGSISTMRGRAAIQMDPSKRRLFGKLTVGKFEMIVPKEQLVAFHEGATYIVYYTTYPKQIMSAEFVAEG
jgi:hypothetical protein